MADSLPVTPALERLTEHNFLPAFEVQRKCRFQPWSEAIFRDCLDGNYFAFGLNLVNQTIGYYVGMLVAGEVTLMDIGVDDQCRGRRYGKVMMSHLLEQSIERNAEVIWLEVRADNQVARHLYRQYGFVEQQIRKGYYETESGRVDAVTMRLDLAP